MSEKKITHISITGDLGSGKSTIARIICEELGFEYLSTGSLQRQLARERGMDTMELNKYANDNKEIDTYIDQKLKDINDQDTPYVLDSRLAWHFVKKSFKVYLMALDEIAAARVLGDEKRVGEPAATDVKAKIKNLRERCRIENERFERYYGVKQDIFNNFDLIVDTSSASTSEVAGLIISLYKKYSSGQNYNRIWLSPFRVFPTQDSMPVEHDSAETAVQELKEKHYDALLPVECVLYDKEFYLVNPHETLAMYMNERLPFIPALLLSKNEGNVTPSLSVAQFAQNAQNIKRFREWENRYGFKFFHYPGDRE